MGAVSSHIADLVARKVSSHGLVVWDDPERAYGDSAASLIPDGVGFAAYEGSWYALRRQIEEAIAGPEPPRLVVYVPAEAPAEDPLSEVRAATGLDRSFKLLLATAMRQALEGKLTEERIEEVAASARTLTEAEEILDQGGGGPVLLVKHLGTSEPIEMIIRIACGQADSALEDHEVREEAARFLAQQLGGEFVARADLSTAVSRRLVAAELMLAGVDLPDLGVEPMSREQAHRSRTVLQRWQADRLRLGELRSRMTEAASALGLGDRLEWTEVYAELDSAPVFDELALVEYLRRYQGGEFAAAASLATSRQGRFWAKWDPDLPWHVRWSIAYSAAHLQDLVRQADAGEGSPEAMLARYESDLWRVDAEHRRLEAALTRIDELGSLEKPVLAARAAYESWLDGYLRSFTKAVSEEGLANGDLLRQGEVHDRRVAPPVAKGERVAYFFVDALRYELGRELATALQRAFGEDSIRVEGAVGAAPSITPVGMANLCPRAHKALRLELDERNRVVVSIDGVPVMTPPERLALLQAAHGVVVDLVLDDLITQGESALREQVGDAKLVMVRSQEIDDAGEGGKLAVAHSFFPVIVEHLRRAVAKLSLVGVSHFVISSDHGFLILSRDVGQHLIIPKPGGRGEVHRRVFIGTGGAAGEELIRVPLSAVGIPGDLDLLAPRGLGLIAAGGARGFFHGGISPQELLVPVITAQIEPRPGAEPLTVEASISGKITSGVFTAKLVLKSGLFAAEPLDASVTAVRVSDGTEVAKLVAAGGADVAQGVVRLTPDEEALVSFQVIGDVAKGDRVELRVMDVRTDRQLAKSKPAPVAADVRVEEGS